MAKQFLTAADTDFLNLQSGNARPYFYMEALIGGVTSVIGDSYTSTNWLIDGGLIDRQKPVFPGDRSSIFSSDVTIKVDNSTRRFSPKDSSSVFFGVDYLDTPFNYWAGFVNISGTALLVQRGSFLLDSLKIESRKNVAYMRLRDKFKKSLEKTIGSRDASGTAIQLTFAGAQSSFDVLQSLFITGASLTAGDLDIQTAPNNYNNISFSEQSVAQAVSLIAESSDGYIYTSRKGVLTFKTNTTVFGTATASFTINESNYAKNVFFEENKEDRLSKVTAEFGSGTSGAYVAESTGINANFLNINNDTLQNLPDAISLATRIKDKFSGQVSRIEIPCVWLPSLDINDKVNLTCTGLGISAQNFDIYKIEEEPTRGEMRLFLLNEHGQKSLTDNKFCFFSDPSATDPSGGTFTGGIGETNGWQAFWGFFSTETTTSTNPGFDADGDANNVINTSISSSGVGGTGIEIPCLFY